MIPIRVPELQCHCNETGNGNLSARCETQGKEEGGGGGVGVGYALPDLDLVFFGALLFLCLPAAGISALGPKIFPLAFGVPKLAPRAGLGPCSDLERKHSNSGRGSGLLLLIN
jgi:hypothetical protein